MNRLMIASAVAVAAAAVSVPAIAGLTNNPSFSHRVPVHVPSQARVVELDDHGKVVDSRRSDHPASTTVTSPHSGEPEPGDDRGQSSAPGDDRSSSSQPGDDRGGQGGSGGSGSGGSGGGGSSGHGG